MASTTARRPPVATTPPVTDGLDAAHHEELARLLEDAAADIRQRPTFTAEDAAAWPVLGADTLPHRDDGSDGTAPGGRTTIVMQLPPAG